MLSQSDCNYLTIFNTVEKEWDFTLFIYIYISLRLQLLLLIVSSIKYFQFIDAPKFSVDAPKVSVIPPRHDTSVK